MIDVEWFDNDKMMAAMIRFKEAAENAREVLLARSETTYNAFITGTRNDHIYHRFKNVGGIRRYVSKARGTHEWQRQPYMVALYKNYGGGGKMVITFMNERQAECDFADFGDMVGVVRRWRNLRKCSISEAHQIGEGVWQLEKIWGSGWRSLIGEKRQESEQKARK